MGWIGVQGGSLGSLLAGRYVIQEEEEDGVAVVLQEGENVPMAIQRGMDEGRIIYEPWSEGER
jgi:hypothetical protein